MTKPMNMRSERIRLGLSTSSVANKVGVSVNTLLSWERGDTSPKTQQLVKLSQLYQCNPEYLMGMTDERRRLVGESHQQAVGIAS